jgi:ElaA protein
VPESSTTVQVRPARDGELDAALALRHAVFVEEQAVPWAEEVDGRDGEALHLVALRGDEVVGTCRLLWWRDSARFGRLAVAPAERGRGIGAALLAAAEEVAAMFGIRRIALHAQTQALTLYERAGYAPCGERFHEAGLEHLPMEKVLA